ncbi:MAG: hypothetical protein FDZ69_13450 [Deltaproteobacteria bacterium]|nr:MAG: hypothetical protein FDZ69_13450 [Deltaproteobacteria bacterium]
MQADDLPACRRASRRPGRRRSPGGRGRSRPCRTCGRGSCSRSSASASRPGPRPCRRPSPAPGARPPRSSPCRCQPARRCSRRHSSFP